MSSFSEELRRTCRIKWFIYFISVEGITQLEDSNQTNTTLLTFERKLYNIDYIKIRYLNLKQTVKSNPK